MNKTLSVAAIVLASMLALTACAETTSSESTGAYVDDATITAKVKAAILGEPGLKSLQIGVETYKDVVQLSGFVDSAQVKARAGEVAAGVSGVQSVRNNLVVK